MCVHLAVASAVFNCYYDITVQKNKPHSGVFTNPVSVVGSFCRSSYVDGVYDKLGICIVHKTKQLIPKLPKTASYRDFFGLLGGKLKNRSVSY